MAFLESASVSNRAAFITAFKAFAVANAGFVDEGTTIDGAYTIHHISKGGIYWNFMEDTYFQTVTNYNIYARMSFAKITTRVSFRLVGSPAGQYIHSCMTCFASAGAYLKYFLYTDGNAVHCVLNIYAGIYTHLSFGNMIKFGTWTGGEYISANNPNYYSGGQYYTWNYNRNTWIFDGGIQAYSAASAYPVGYVRHVVGSAGNDHTDFSRIGGKEENNQWCKMVVGKLTSHTFISDLIDICSPISFNTRAPIFPIYVRTLEDATQRYILIGHIPYARAVNVKNLGAEAVVENDWITFPLCQKEGGSRVLAPTTDYWGVAYKRVA